jgi:hypothetical protein
MVVVRLPRCGRVIPAGDVSLLARSSVLVMMILWRYLLGVMSYPRSISMDDEDDDEDDDDDVDDDVDDGLRSPAMVSVMGLSDGL